MKQISNLSDLLSLATKDGNNSIVKFTEDVEFVCDVDDRNLIIESTASLTFLKGCHVLKLQAGRGISAGMGISAGGFISAGYGISAGWGISAGMGISAGYDIKAGDGIKAGDYISAGDGISAGWGISAGEKITALFVKSDKFDIKCKSLQTTQLPFWRSYWAAQLPLLPWKEQILNDENCWHDLKKLATIEEKEKIVNWEGWHPILKAQLQMFLELKTEIEFS